MKFSTHAAIFWWQPGTWLKISGADAANFLQGQFTNDLRVIPANAAVYGLWLNVKGKVVADSFVLRGQAADEFWIASYFSPAPVIRERLEGFVIADDVILEDATADWSAVTIFDEGIAATVVGVAHMGFFFRGRRGTEENVEWIFPTSQREAVRASLAGLNELSAAEIARRRIEAGIPAIPLDLGMGDLPNEGGLEVDAISYTKGCYLGQEVMARLKTMGQVRRRLVRVMISSGEIPSLPAPLFLGARQVGELRSIAPNGGDGSLGLAMVSLLHVAAGARLAFEPTAPAIVTVGDLQ
jgi:folate-binding protein YgfZ